jgi:hypothetical protein
MELGIDKLNVFKRLPRIFSQITPDANRMIRSNLVSHKVFARFNVVQVHVLFTLELLFKEISYEEYLPAKQQQLHSRIWRIKSLVAE